MYWWPATRKMDRRWEMFVAQVITSKSICSKTCACGREHDFCEVLGTNPRQCIPLMVLLSPRCMTQWPDFAAVKCRPDISSYFWWQVTWEHVALNMCGGQRRTAKLWRQVAALLSAQAYFFRTFCTCKLLCGSCPLETCFNSLPLLWSFITSGGDLRGDQLISLLFLSAISPSIISVSRWNSNPPSQGSTRNTHPYMGPRERLELLSLLCNLPAVAGSAGHSHNRVSTTLFAEGCPHPENSGPMQSLTLASCCCSVTWMWMVHAPFCQAWPTSLPWHLEDN